VFTSSVLANLVEDKTIKLTDPINSLYPFDFKDNIQLTFQDLANHSSGLPRLPVNLEMEDIANPYQKYGKSKIEEYLKEHITLENEPRTTSSYSNLGVGLLGYTLGVSRKTSFQELLQKEIFDQYNMSHSYTTTEVSKKQLVLGMNEYGDEVSNWDFDALFGAGGILSTTEDLAKFAYAQFNEQNSALTVTHKPTIEINENMSVGLGWHIITTKSGDTILWHNGGTGGYSSHLSINLENKTAVIILSNVADANDSVDDLGFELIKQIKE